MYTARNFDGLKNVGLIVHKYKVIKQIHLNQKARYSLREEILYVRECSCSASIVAVAVLRTDRYPAIIVKCEIYAELQTRIMNFISI